MPPVRGQRYPAMSRKFEGRKQTIRDLILANPTITNVEIARKTGSHVVNTVGKVRREMVAQQLAHALTPCRQGLVHSRHCWCKGPITYQPDRYEAMRAHFTSKQPAPIPPRLTPFAGWVLTCCNGLFADDTIARRWVALHRPGCPKPGWQPFAGELDIAQDGAA